MTPRPDIYSRSTYYVNGRRALEGHEAAKVKYADEPDGRITRCDHCGRKYFKTRADQRFCDRDCNKAFHLAERRAALKHFRENPPTPTDEAAE